MRIVVTGSKGQLGQDVVKLLEAQHQVHGLGREDLDFTNEGQCMEVIQRLQPDVIIHCAAYTAVDLQRRMNWKHFE